LPLARTGHCKLIRKKQLKLLEYFVLEVTARSAADLLDIQPNSAALFYRKLREIIAYQLAQKEHEVFDGMDQASVVVDFLCCYLWAGQR
jgi:transposase